MATIKKMQGGGLIKKALKAASEAAPKVKKELSVFQKMRLDKGKPLTNFNMDEQKASGALNKAINSRTNPEAAVKKMTKAQRQAKEIDDSYRKNGGAVKKKMKNGGSLSGLKASTKRVGPVDPKGAFTKVQKKTLAGAKGKTSLTKDKQLGATKMAKRGMKISKKK